MSQVVTAWTGERVRLRAIVPDDWEYYLRFNEDAIQARNVLRVLPPMSEAGQRARLQQLGNQRDDNKPALAIERTSGPVIVGAISIKHADRRSGSFEHGLAVDRNHQRAGLGTEATILLLRYMFGERRYHKSIVSIYDFNQPSIVFHRKLGYVQEGRLREQEFFGGRYCDVILMGLTAEEFFQTRSPIALERPA